jgi:hypothetical protein
VLLVVDTYYSLMGKVLGSSNFAWGNNKTGKKAQ